MPISPLTNPHSLIILTTAPTGLGHLRVTKALLEGLPIQLHSFVLGLNDKTMTNIHRLSSINPFFAGLQSLIQTQPTAEHMFTKSFRQLLRSSTDNIEYQLETLLTSHQPHITKAVIVATHFGLAHQIAAIKDKLIAATGVTVELMVVVTDATYQTIWAIDGADFMTVPSSAVKLAYNKYFTDQKLPKPKIIVLPYPVSPFLGEKNSVFTITRTKQLNPFLSIPTNVIIPISGAAVQLEYLQRLSFELTKPLSKTFKISVVAKTAPFTQSFLHTMTMLPYTQVVSAQTNQQAVDWYEREFRQETLPSLEITKPSEQAFKALFTANQRGGVLLLFTEPVGRQEIDNINFLAHHHLLPSRQEQDQLHQLIEGHPASQALVKAAKKWRGIQLPSNPFQAAKLIIACRKEGIFLSMLEAAAPTHPEVSSNGVVQFWDLVTTALR